MGSDQALARLRSAKHAAWLVRRRAWAAVEPGLAPAIDVALRAYTRARPPRSESLLGLQTASAPRRIFCLWTGHNPMSPNRERAMEEIRRLNEPSVEVEFVTPETLDRWILAEHPLHPAYEGLSLIHRADYLRTYLDAPPRWRLHGRQSSHVFVGSRIRRDQCRPGCLADRLPGTELPFCGASAPSVHGESSKPTMPGCWATVPTYAGRKRLSPRPG